MSPKALKKHKDNFRFYWNQSLIVDPFDLFPLKKDDTLEKEYCKKAVKLKQWDHIYYLTQGVDIVSCLEDGEKQWSGNAKGNPCCREAMKLAAKGWSKEDLYSGEILNPSADEMLPGAYKEVAKLIRDTILKATGRDLDKEPPLKNGRENIIFKQ